MPAQSSAETADQALLLRRQMMLTNLRRRYARFGDELVQYLCESAFRRGGLRRAIGKAVHPVPLDEDRMHEMFIRFLATEGVEAFFTRVRGKKDSMIVNAPDLHPVTERYARAFLFQPAAAPSAISRASYAATAPATLSPETDTAEVESTWHGTERRAGFERRLGVERRSGKDRRGDVELIYENRRFGRDRRSGGERRDERERRHAPPPGNL